jgi:predicted transcriptional regulator
MRTTKIFSLSLPPELLREAETLAKREGRTKSELLREALSRYLQDRSGGASSATAPGTRSAWASATTRSNESSPTPAKRYSRDVKLAIELSPGQAERLRHEAERLGIAPEELAQAALADLLATRDDDFKAAAQRVLRKNEELYRRLA